MTTTPTPKGRKAPAAADLSVQELVEQYGLIGRTGEVRVPAGVDAVAAAPASPTYKHPESGRYYRTMTPRSTGLPVTTGHGDDLDLGVADDGAWWTVCDEHGWAYSWPTQIAARYGCATPLAWCPTCQDVANDNGGAK